MDDDLLQPLNPDIPLANQYQPVQKPVEPMPPPETGDDGVRKLSYDDYFRLAKDSLRVDHRREIAREKYRADQEAARDLFAEQMDYIREVADEVFASRRDYARRLDAATSARDGLVHRNQEAAVSVEEAIFKIRMMTEIGVNGGREEALAELDNAFNAGNPALPSLSRAGVREEMSANEAFNHIASAIGSIADIERELRDPSTTDARLRDLEIRLYTAHKRLFGRENDPIFEQIDRESGEGEGKISLRERYRELSGNGDIASIVRMWGFNPINRRQKKSPKDGTGYAPNGILKEAVGFVADAFGATRSAILYEGPYTDEDAMFRAISSIPTMAERYISHLDELYDMCCARLGGVPREDLDKLDWTDIAKSMVSGPAAGVVNDQYRQLAKLALSAKLTLSGATAQQGVPSHLRRLTAWEDGIRKGMVTAYKMAIVNWFENEEVRAESAVGLFGALDGRLSEKGRAALSKVIEKKGSWGHELAVINELEKNRDFFGLHLFDSLRSTGYGRAEYGPRNLLGVGRFLDRTWFGLREMVSQLGSFVQGVVDTVSEANSLVEEDAELRYAVRAARYGANRYKPSEYAIGRMFDGLADTTAYMAVAAGASWLHGAAALAEGNAAVGLTAAAYGADVAATMSYAEPFRARMLEAGVNPYLALVASSVTAALSLRIEKSQVTDAFVMNGAAARFATRGSWKALARYMKDAAVAGEKGLYMQMCRELAHGVVGTATNAFVLGAIVTAKETLEEAMQGFVEESGHGAATLFQALIDEDALAKGNGDRPNSWTEAVANAALETLRQGVESLDVTTAFGLQAALFNGPGARQSRHVHERAERLVRRDGLAGRVALRQADTDIKRATGMVAGASDAAIAAMCEEGSGDTLAQDLGETTLRELRDLHRDYSAYFSERDANLLLPGGAQAYAIADGLEHPSVSYDPQTGEFSISGEVASTVQAAGEDTVSEGRQSVDVRIRTNGFEAVMSEDGRSLRDSSDPAVARLVDTIRRAQLVAGEGDAIDNAKWDAMDTAGREELLRKYGALPSVEVDGNSIDIMMFTTLGSALSGSAASFNALAGAYEGVISILMASANENIRKAVKSYVDLYRERRTDLSPAEAKREVARDIARRVIAGNGVRMGRGGKLYRAEHAVDGMGRIADRETRNALRWNSPATVNFMHLFGGMLRLLARAAGFRAADVSYAIGSLDEPANVMGENVFDTMASTVTDVVSAFSESAHPVNRGEDVVVENPSDSKNPHYKGSFGGYVKWLTDLRRENQAAAAAHDAFMAWALLGRATGADGEGESRADRLKAALDRALMRCEDIASGINAIGNDVSAVKDATKAATAPDAAGRQSIAALIRRALDRIDEYERRIGKAEAGLTQEALRENRISLRLAEYARQINDLRTAIASLEGLGEDTLGKDLAKRVDEAARKAEDFFNQYKAPVDFAAEILARAAEAERAAADYVASVEDTERLRSAYSALFAAGARVDKAKAALDKFLASDEWVLATQGLTEAERKKLDVLVETLKKLRDESERLYVAEFYDSVAPNYIDETVPDRERRKGLEDKAIPEVEQKIAQLRARMAENLANAQNSGNLAQLQQKRDALAAELDEAQYAAVRARDAVKVLAGTPGLAGSKDETAAGMARYFLAQINERQEQIKNERKAMALAFFRRFGSGISKVDPGAVDALRAEIDALDWKLALYARQAQFGGPVPVTPEIRAQILDGLRSLIAEATDPDSPEVKGLKYTLYMLENNGVNVDAINSENDRLRAEIASLRDRLDKTEDGPADGQTLRGWKQRRAALEDDIRRHEYAIEANTKRLEQAKADQVPASMLNSWRRAESTIYAKAKPETLTAIQRARKEELRRADAPAQPEAREKYYNQLIEQARQKRDQAAQDLQRATAEAEARSAYDALAAERDTLAAQAVSLSQTVAGRYESALVAALGGEYHAKALAAAIKEVDDAIRYLLNTADVELVRSEDGKTLSERTVRKLEGSREIEDLRAKADAMRARLAALKAAMPSGAEGLRGIGATLGEEGAAAIEARVRSKYALSMVADGLRGGLSDAAVRLLLSDSFRDTLMETLGSAMKGVKSSSSAVAFYRSLNEALENTKTAKAILSALQNEIKRLQDVAMRALGLSLALGESDDAAAAARVAQLLKNLLNADAWTRAIWARNGGITLEGRSLMTPGVSPAAARALGVIDRETETASFHDLRAADDPDYGEADHNATAYQVLERMFGRQRIDPASDKYGQADFWKRAARLRDAQPIADILSHSGLPAGEANDFDLMGALGYERDSDGKFRLSFAPTPERENLVRQLLDALDRMAAKAKPVFDEAKRGKRHIVRIASNAPGLHSGKWIAATPDGSGDFSASANIAANEAAKAMADADVSAITPDLRRIFADLNDKAARVAIDPGDLVFRLCFFAVPDAADGSGGISGAFDDEAKAMAKALRDNGFGTSAYDADAQARAQAEVAKILEAARDKLAKIVPMEEGETGSAIADVLAGRVPFAGDLAIRVAKAAGMLPDFTTVADFEQKVRADFNTMYYGATDEDLAAAVLRAKAALLADVLDSMDGYINVLRVKNAEFTRRVTGEEYEELRKMVSRTLPSGAFSYHRFSQLASKLRTSISLSRGFRDGRDPVVRNRVDATAAFDRKVVRDAITGDYDIMNIAQAISVNGYVDAAAAARLIGNKAISTRLSEMAEAAARRNRAVVVFPHANADALSSETLDHIVVGTVFVDFRGPVCDYDIIAADNNTRDTLREKLAVAIQYGMRSLRLDPYFRPITSNTISGVGDKFLNTLASMRVREGRNVPKINTVKANGEASSDEGLGPFVIEGVEPPYAVSEDPVVIAAEHKGPYVTAWDKTFAFEGGDIGNISSDDIQSAEAALEAIMEKGDDLSESDAFFILGSITPDALRVVGAVYGGYFMSEPGSDMRKSLLVNLIGKALDGKPIVISAEETDGVPTTPGTFRLRKTTEDGKDAFFWKIGETPGDADPYSLSVCRHIDSVINALDVGSIDEMTVPSDEDYGTPIDKVDGIAMVQIPLRPKNVAPANHAEAAFYKDMELLSDRWRDKGERANAAEALVKAFTRQDGTPPPFKADDVVEFGLVISKDVLDEPFEYGNIDPENGNQQWDEAGTGEYSYLRVNVMRSDGDIQQYYIPVETNLLPAVQAHDALVFASNRVNGGTHMIAIDAEIAAIYQYKTSPDTLHEAYREEIAEWNSVIFGSGDGEDGAVAVPTDLRQAPERPLPPHPLDAAIASLGGATLPANISDSPLSESPTAGRTINPLTFTDQFGEVDYGNLLAATWDFGYSGDDEVVDAASGPVASALSASGQTRLRALAIAYTRAIYGTRFDRIVRRLARTDPKYLAVDTRKLARLRSELDRERSADEESRDPDRIEKLVAEIAEVESRKVPTIPGFNDVAASLRDIRRAMRLPRAEADGRDANVAERNQGALANAVAEAISANGSIYALDFDGTVRAAIASIEKSLEAFRDRESTLATLKREQKEYKESLESKRKEEREKILKLNLARSALDEKRATLADPKAVAALEDKGEALRSEVAELANEVAALEKDLRENTGAEREKIRSLRDKAMEHADNVAGKREGMNYNSVRAMLNRARTKLGMKRATLADPKAVAALKDKGEALRSEVAELQEKITALERDLRENTGSEYEEWHGRWTSVFEEKYASLLKDAGLGMDADAERRVERIAALEDENERERGRNAALTSAIGVLKKNRREIADAPLVAAYLRSARFLNGQIIGLEQKAGIEPGTLGALATTFATEQAPDDRLGERGMFSASTERAVGTLVEDFLGRNPEAREASHAIVITQGNIGPAAWMTNLESYGRRKNITFVTPNEDSARFLRFVLYDRDFDRILKAVKAGGAAQSPSKEDRQRFAQVMPGVFRRPGKNATVAEGLDGDTAMAALSGFVHNGTAASDDVQHFLEYYYALVMSAVDEYIARDIASAQRIADNAAETIAEMEERKEGLEKRRDDKNVDAEERAQIVAALDDLDDAIARTKASEKEARKKLSDAQNPMALAYMRQSRANQIHDKFSVMLKRQADAIRSAVGREYVRERVNVVSAADAGEIRELVPHSGRQLVLLTKDAENAVDMGSEIQLPSALGEADRHGFYDKAVRYAVESLDAGTPTLTLIDVGQRQGDLTRIADDSEEHTEDWSGSFRWQKLLSDLEAAYRGGFHDYGTGESGYFANKFLKYNRAWGFAGVNDPAADRSTAPKSPLAVLQAASETLPAQWIADITESPDFMANAATDRNLLLRREAVSKKSRSKHSRGTTVYEWRNASGQFLPGFLRGTGRGPDVSRLVRYASDYAKGAMLGNVYRVKMEGDKNRMLLVVEILGRDGERLTLAPVVVSGASSAQTAFFNTTASSAVLAVSALRRNPARSGGSPEAERAAASRPAADDADRLRARRSALENEVQRLEEKIHDARNMAGLKGVLAPSGEELQAMEAELAQDRERLETVRQLADEAVARRNVSYYTAAMEEVAAGDEADRSDPFAGLKGSLSGLGIPETELEDVSKILDAGSADWSAVDDLRSRIKAAERNAGDLSDRARASRQGYEKAIRKLGADGHPFIDRFLDMFHETGFEPQVNIYPLRQLPSEPAKRFLSQAANAGFKESGSEMDTLGVWAWAWRARNELRDAEARLEDATRVLGNLQDEKAELSRRIPDGAVERRAREARDAIETLRNLHGEFFRTVSPLAAAANGDAVAAAGVPKIADCRQFVADVVSRFNAMFGTDISVDVATGDTIRTRDGLVVTGRYSMAERRIEVAEGASLLTFGHEVFGHAMMEWLRAHMPALHDAIEREAGRLGLTGAEGVARAFERDILNAILRARRRASIANGNGLVAAASRLLNLLHRAWMAVRRLFGWRYENLPPREAVARLVEDTILDRGTRLYERYNESAAMANEIEAADAELYRETEEEDGEEEDDEDGEEAGDDESDEPETEPAIDYEGHAGNDEITEAFGSLNDWEYLPFEMWLWYEKDIAPHTPLTESRKNALFREWVSGELRRDGIDAVSEQAVRNREKLYGEGRDGLDVEEGTPEAPHKNGLYPATPDAKAEKPAKPPISDKEIEPPMTKAEAKAIEDGLVISVATLSAPYRHFTLKAFSERMERYAASLLIQGKNRKTVEGRLRTMFSLTGEEAARIVDKANERRVERIGDYLENAPEPIRRLLENNEAQARVRAYVEDIMRDSARTGAAETGRASRRLRDAIRGRSMKFETRDLSAIETETGIGFDRVVMLTEQFLRDNEEVQRRIGRLRKDRAAKGETLSEAEIADIAAGLVAEPSAEAVAKIREAAAGLVGGSVKGEQLFLKYGVSLSNPASIVELVKWMTFEIARRQKPELFEGRKAGDEFKDNAPLLLLFSRHLAGWASAISREHCFPWTYSDKLSDICNRLKNGYYASEHTVGKAGRNLFQRVALDLVGKTKADVVASFDHAARAALNEHTAEFGESDLDERDEDGNRVRLKMHVSDRRLSDHIRSLTAKYAKLARRVAHMNDASLDKFKAEARAVIDGSRDEGVDFISEAEARLRLEVAEKYGNLRSRTSAEAQRLAGEFRDTLRAYRENLARFAADFDARRAEVLSDMLPFLRDQQRVNEPSSRFGRNVREFFDEHVGNMSVFMKAVGEGIEDSSRKVAYEAACDSVASSLYEAEATMRADQAERDDMLDRRMRDEATGAGISLQRAVDLLDTRLDRESSERLNQIETAHHRRANVRWTYGHVANLYLALSHIRATYSSERLAKFEKNGQDDAYYAIVRDIVNGDETLRRVIGVFQRDLQSNWEADKDAYRRMTQSELPDADVETYWPLHFVTDPAANQGMFKSNDPLPHSFSARLKHDYAVDPHRDVYSVWLARKNDSSRLRAFARDGYFVRSVLLDKELLSEIERVMGPKFLTLWKNKVSTALAGSQMEEAMSYDKLVGWSARAIARIYLAGNLSSIATQMSSGTAAMLRLGIRGGFRSLASFIAHPTLWASTWRDLMSTKYARSRYNGGFSIIQRFVKRSGDGSVERGTLLDKAFSPLFNTLMSGMEFGDKFALVLWFGGHFRALANDLMAQGVAPDEAKDRAARQVFMYAEEVLQSKMDVNKNHFQTNRHTSVLFEFVTSQNQQMQFELKAWRDLLANPGDHDARRRLASAILVNHFITPVLMTLAQSLARFAVSYAISAGGAEPPDEDELVNTYLLNLLTSCISGTFSGIILLGSVIEPIVRSAVAKGFDEKPRTSRIQYPYQAAWQIVVDDVNSLIRAKDGYLVHNALVAFMDLNPISKEIRKKYMEKAKTE